MLQTHIIETSNNFVKYGCLDRAHQKIEFPMIIKYFYTYYKFC